MVKFIYWIQHTKKNKNRKKEGKDGKALYQLINNAIFGKTMENLRNKSNGKLVNNKKDYLKCTSKLRHISHKIFDNKLVLIEKSKASLKINKSPYIGMCISEFSIQYSEFRIQYKLHYDYIKTKYDNKSKLLFTDTDSLI